MVFGLFGGTRAEKKSDPKIWTREALKHTSFHDLIQNFLAAPEAMTPNSCVNITERLLEIIFEDETISVEDRERARRIVSSVIETTEDGFKNNPAGLEAYRNAYKTQIEGGRKFGIGSLAHKIQKIPTDKIVDEIVRLENATLLVDFPKNIIADHRADCIKALIRNRLPAKEPSIDDFENWLFQKIKYGNAVNSAGWLILTRDPTALCLFDENECRALARYLVDYEAARLVLVENNIISISRPLSFTPIPDPNMVHQFMLRTSADRNTADIDPVRGDEREKLLQLDREARVGIQGILIAYRLFVWQKTVLSIYGEAYLNQINAIHPEAEVNKLTKTLTAQMSALYDIATDPTKEIAFDSAIIAQMMYDYLDRTLPERVLDGMVKSCVDVIRNEMFYFPPYVRYLIRTLVHGNEKSVEALVEDTLI